LAALVFIHGEDGAGELFAGGLDEVGDGVYGGFGGMVSRMSEVELGCVSESKARGENVFG